MLKSVKKQTSLPLEYCTYLLLFDCILSIAHQLGIHVSDQYCLITMQFQPLEQNPSANLPIFAGVGWYLYHCKINLSRSD